MKNEEEHAVDDIPPTFQSREYINRNVNLYTAEKAYKLELGNGPYYTRYCGNGSHMMIFNKTNYLETFDTQKLVVRCELENKIEDAVWLHNSKYFAGVESEGLFVYNQDGSELHAVRKIRDGYKMKFLPYHFLLSVATSHGKLEYLDTTMGSVVSSVYIKDKSIKTICNNLSNGVVFLGSKSGVISGWSPAQKEYLLRLHVGKSPIVGICIDREGNEMKTLTSDGLYRSYDLRNTVKHVKKLNMNFACTGLAMSQKGILAASSGRKVFLVKDEKISWKYIFSGSVSSMEFCNYEDILTIGNDTGIENIVVPGSGDHVYDSREESPFMTKKEQKELEVKRILDKIPYDLISHENILKTLGGKKTDVIMPEINMRYHENRERGESALDRFRK